MILILVRHAEAQNRDMSVDDDNRTLTAKGIRGYKKTVRGLRSVLHDAADVMILSSPLTRALQTAQLLKEGFKAKEIRALSCISEGDLGAFVKELSGYANEDHVFVTGHEPHLGNWSEALCGVKLPFKKGACAALEYTSLKPYNSSLLWFSQPGMLKKLKVK